jgi:WD40 repeat protein
MISLNENLINLIMSSLRVKALNDKLKQAKNSLISKSILNTMSYEMRFKQIGQSTYLLNESTISFNPITELRENNLLTVDRNKLKIWDIIDYKCIKSSFEENESWITSIALLPDGNIICSTNDYKIKIWELGEIIRCVKTILIENYEYLEYLLLLPDGNIACTAEHSFRDISCILILDPNRDYIVQELNETYTSEKCLTLLTNSFASFSNMVINIWDIDNDYKCIKKLSGHTYYIDCLLFIDRYNLLISGSKDGKIKI